MSFLFFHPMIMQSDFNWLAWVIPLSVSTIMGVMIFQGRSSFRKGKVEATAIGKSELNTNLVTNAIREIEALKLEVRRLCEEVQKERITSARFEERMNSILDKIDSLHHTVSDFIRSSGGSGDAYPSYDKRNRESDSEGAYSRDRRDKDTHYDDSSRYSSSKQQK